jgi:hypothetical protein
MFQRLSQLHVLRTALALALIAGFLATPVGIAHAGRADHDPCDALLLGQDPGSPRMEPAAGRDGHGHCFTCHWFQSLRSALAATGVAIPDAGADGPFAPDAPSFAAACANASAGARAPPA